MLKLSRQQAIASLFSAALLGPAALASSAQTSTNARYGMVVQSKGKVTRIDKADWAQEMTLHNELFAQLAYHLPKELVDTKAQLEKRLAA